MSTFSSFKTSKMRLEFIKNYCTPFVQLCETLPAVTYRQALYKLQYTIPSCKVFRLCMGEGFPCSRSAVCMSHGPTLVLFLSGTRGIYVLAMVCCSLMCLVAKNSLFPTLLGQQFPRAGKQYTLRQ